MIDKIWDQQKDKWSVTWILQHGCLMCKTKYFKADKHIYGKFRAVPKHDWPH